MACAFVTTMISLDVFCFCFQDNLLQSSLAVLLADSSVLSTLSIVVFFWLTLLSAHNSFFFIFLSFISSLTFFIRRLNLASQLTTSLLEDDLEEEAEEEVEKTLDQTIHSQRSLPKSPVSVLTDGHH